MNGVVERTTIASSAIVPHELVRLAVPDIDNIVRYTFLAVADIIRDSNVSDAQLPAALTTLSIMSRARERLGMPHAFDNVDNIYHVVESVVLEVLGKVESASRWQIGRRVLWTVGEDIVLDFIGRSVVDRRAKTILLKHLVPALAPQFGAPQIAVDELEARSSAWSDEQCKKHAEQLVRGADGQARSALVLVAGAIEHVAAVRRSSWQKALLAAINAAGFVGHTAAQTRASVAALVARYGALATSSAPASESRRAAAPCRARALLGVIDGQSGVVNVAPQLTPLRSASRGHVLFTDTVLRHCVKFDQTEKQLRPAALAELALPGNSLKRGEEGECK